LLATTASADVGDAMKEAYNAATPATGQRFAAEIAKNLAFYDAFDGVCGNAFMASTQLAPTRYGALAALLADDRLWINSRSTTCTQLMAVELAETAHASRASDDCGGRAPNYDAVNVYRS